MKKYITLEQALNDASLAIITENITTHKGLIKAYVKYRALPKKQKRFSDYYSNEFLGHDVTEMYALVKDKLRADSDIFSDMQLPSGTYVHSEPDLYYKEESFNSGDTNVCFILGHSGSGKSMMARTLEGDDIDHIELDDLLLTRDHFTMDELKEYSDMFYSFFIGEGAKYYIGIDERDSIPKEEYEDKVFIDFVRFAMEYAKQHREKKYIIDGIWIYLYFDDPSVFEDYAVFIKGTSFLKSKIRATKREMQRDKETLQDRKQMFGREVRNYLLDEDKINSYRSFFGDSPYTIYRDEANEADKRSEAVIDALNSINRCFVNGDADGINEIMQRAEANAELSNWNKLRIINECKSALLDLRTGSLRKKGRENTDTFTDALLSDKTDKIPEEYDWFSPLVGDWDCDYYDELIEGQKRHVKGEWIFRRVLEGAGIQDIFIFPSRDTREANPQPDAEYGTSLRIFNKKHGWYDVVYTCAGTMKRLTFRKEDGRLAGKVLDEENTYWIFSDITETGFHWEYVILKNDGSRELVCEIFGKRVLS